MTMTDPLSEFAIMYGTDKGYGHWYTPHYHKRFAELREEPVRLLEIGIGGYDNPQLGGESLKMWRSYFGNPDAVIVGVDITPKDPSLAPGCVVLQGDQSSPKDLHRIGKEFGPFDIIIDDGSHIVDHVLQSWVVLWTDYLKDGGWYVIEDLQTAYWPKFGGSSIRTGDSTIGFLCGLIDRIHYAELDVPGYNPNRFDKSVVEMDIVHNLAFLKRGDNTFPPSNVMPPHPHPLFWGEDDAQS